MSTKINKNTIKCVVFDLDGTLLDTIKTINYYLNIALEMNGVKAVTEMECLGFVGYGAKWLVECALRNSDSYSAEMLTKVLKDYNSVYNADPYYLTEVYDGVLESLEALREQGISLAVLSNKPDFAVREVVSRFLPDVFSYVGGAKDGVPLKPRPDSLIAILSELGFSSDEAVYVGDSEVDVETARNANMPCISVSWGFRTAEQLKEAGATHLATTPNEMTTIILK